MVYEHAAAAAAWLTVKVCPAIAIVPLRWLLPALAATVKPTVPLPLPLPPEVTVIQGLPALLTAVQVQPLVVVTVTGLPAPPFAPTDWLFGAMLYPHAGCVIGMARPAIVIVPFRSVPVVFGAAVNGTVPLPLAPVPGGTVIHEALLTAVHEQAAVVVTVKAVPAPPPAAIDWLVGAI